MNRNFIEFNAKFIVCGDCFFFPLSKEKLSRLHFLNQIFVSLQKLSILLYNANSFLLYLGYNFESVIPVLFYPKFFAFKIILAIISQLLLTADHILA